MTTCRHSFCADCKRSVAVAVRGLLRWLLYARRRLLKPAAELPVAVTATDGQMPFTRYAIAIVAIKPTIPAHCKVVLRFGA